MPRILAGYVECMLSTPTSYVSAMASFRALFVALLPLPLELVVQRGEVLNSL